MLVASTLVRSIAVVPELFVALALVAAVVDWVAVASTNERTARLERWAKPAVPLALIGVAATASCSHSLVRVLLILALIGCLGGDVALMLPDPTGRLFLVGLGSFLVGQVLIAWAYAIQPHGMFLTGLSVIALLFTAPLTVILRHLSRDHRSLLIPVTIYVVAIVIMASLAVASGLQPGLRPKASLVGGLAFVLSDTLLAFNRFVRPLPRGALMVHSTYHVAIIGLTIGVMAAS